jgi:hypothetical protein
MAASTVLLVRRSEKSENGFHLNNRYSSDFLKISNPNAVV